MSKLGQPLTAFGNKCAARFCLLILVCLALSIHWVVMWLHTWTKGDGNDAVFNSHIYTYNVENELNKSDTLVAVTYKPNCRKDMVIMSRHTWSLTLPWHTLPQVEQPASSHLIQMPYLRMLIDSIYTKGTVNYQRLWLGWCVKGKWNQKNEWPPKFMGQPCAWQQRFCPWLVGYKPANTNNKTVYLYQLDAIVHILFLANLFHHLDIYILI